MRKSLFAFLMLLWLGACATTQAGPNGLADRDPREGLNRDVWAVNQAVDDAVLEPVASAYRAVTPRPARTGLSNLFRNLSEPWSFVNNILQGKPGRAINNLGRFIVNSTIGIAGLVDVASEIGIEPAPEDFGQTLAVWGVGDGGYAVIPVLGPSTARDAVGSIVGFLANPTTLFLDRVAGFNTLELWGVRAGEIVSTRADLIDSGVDSFLESSADPYATARSAYFETREASILDYDVNGLTGSDEDIESAEDAAFEAAMDDLPGDAPNSGEDPAEAGPQPPADEFETETATDPAPLGD